MDPHSHVGNDSPPTRTTLLGSFLRSGRPRNSSQSHTDQQRELSPSPPTQNAPASPGAQAAIAAGVNYGHRLPSSSSNQAGSLGLSQMLRRRRSAGAINPNSGNTNANVPPSIAANSSTHNRTQNASGSHPPPLPPTSPGTFRVRLVPHLESRRSLKFDAITRDLKPTDAALRIGRFTDRSGLGLSAVNALGSNKLAFKSKVVSRAHAEISVDAGGKFWIKDTKSSSGTFLNHMRLSPANTESRLHQMRDGDILQLGVDYQGGTEDIYKSVKIRIELGREWQASANAFNTTAIKNLKTLAVNVTAGTRTVSGPKASSKSAFPDCCICLFGVTIRQALFIAPCSHTFHYKCIRPLLESHHPAFSCPLCRTFADLEEDVEVEIEYEEEAEADLEVVEEAAASAYHGASGTNNALNGTVNGHGDDDGEDSAVEEVAAALRSAPSPQVAAERERERERDREAGAETEVESDIVGAGDSAGRTRRSRNSRRQQPRAMSLMDEGEEAHSGPGEPVLPPGGPSEEELELLDDSPDENGRVSIGPSVGADAIMVDASIRAGSSERGFDATPDPDDDDMVLVDASASNGRPLSSGMIGIEGGNEDGVGGGGKRKR
ncbi:hypothetical protein E1B28_005809 [Marasmius oreades]|uniref:SMAD/FHA domain-containing protein n=1 Tax=Marasmius oreades TaxID=181124 RepID=A0A9P7UV73_9AGAR|nr:uncharacterized protein E1B28_005809 [Marasmius oreades]KAG7095015.1 hypothetical protein E1B28_005809 [Marasmius oreades]